MLLAVRLIGTNPESKRNDFRIIGCQDWRLMLLKVEVLECFTPSEILLNIAVYVSVTV